MRTKLAKMTLILQILYVRESRRHGRRYRHIQIVNQA
jgi:hypothetical protein